jgi:hypothetical protein
MTAVPSRVLTAPGPSPAVATALFAATIFSSAFLLFLVQPLIAKQILPWFGGSAAVWTVCMVFFQSLLLGGYAYADALARGLRPRMQAWVHGGLLLASLTTLPILASARWKPGGGEDPTWAILGLLAATIGLPYFLLSSTGPLLQAWLARAPWGVRVYRYFSLSNAASLLSLLAYPVLLEPWLPMRAQALGWSFGFAAFVVLAIGCAAVALRLDAAEPTGSRSAGGADAAAPALADQLSWLALPALGTWMLLAVTNEMTQNVAAIPFLWILPLAAYLLTFILCFESDRWYRRRIVLPTAVAALALGGWSHAEGLVHGVLPGVVFNVALLFVLCLALHGETAQLRPAPRWLTRYYVALAAGGALGGIVVGLGAPLVLTGYHEFGIGLALTAALGALRWRGRWRAMAFSLGLAALCGLFVVRDMAYDAQVSRRAMRNFYGTLQTTDSGAVRVLWHGSVKHGEQYLDPARRREPTAYYGRSAGIGQLLTGLPAAPARVGLVGLGAGTLAVYARPGDVYRLYEINPQVFELARSEFSFLADSAARQQDVLGDARIAMEREPPQRLDVLAVDAFSGGAIPVHLLTTQAIEVYLRHLAPRGVLAFHLTNRHLDLPPVLLAAARARGLAAAWVHDDAEGSDLRRTDWVLLSREPAALAGLQGVVPSPRTLPAPWTDDVNNLLLRLR